MNLWWLFVEDIADKIFYKKLRAKTSKRFSKKRDKMTNLYKTEMVDVIAKKAEHQKNPYKVKF